MGRGEPTTAMVSDICLVIPDGVGVRNFVLGPFLGLASVGRRVHALHAIPEALLPTYASDANGNVSWHRLLAHRDRPVSFILRRSLDYSQMYWVDTHIM